MPCLPPTLREKSLFGPLFFFPTPPSSFPWLFPLTRTWKECIFKSRGKRRGFSFLSPFLPLPLSLGIRMETFLRRDRAEGAPARRRGEDKKFTLYEEIEAACFLSDGRPDIMQGGGGGGGAPWRGVIIRRAAQRRCDRCGRCLRCGEGKGRGRIELGERTKRTSCTERERERGIELALSSPLSLSWEGELRPRLASHILLSMRCHLAPVWNPKRASSSPPTKPAARWTKRGEGAWRRRQHVRFGRRIPKYPYFFLFWGGMGTVIAQTFMVRLLLRICSRCS